MDFLFATSQGTMAFPAYTRREAISKADRFAIRYWIVTGSLLRRAYLGPVHPKHTVRLCKASPRNKAQYRKARDRLPV